MIVDVYPLDLGGEPKWPVLAAASDDTTEYVGAILKATEGTNYDYDWFTKNWPLVRSIGGERYGVDWFRGAYHFLRFAQSGPAQADFYLKTIDKAGGWGKGDILPIVDVELGGPSSSNYHATAQQIIDCTSAFVARVKAVAGRKVILYGRGAMRDKNIASKMGCDVVWNPSYTTTMITNGLVPTWKLDEIAIWQYSGDGEGSLPNYPRSIPGFGKPDLSVYVDGANKPSLATLRARLL